MLHFQMVQSDLAPPTKNAVLIHGIMGSSRNVMSFAKLIVQKFPDWQVILPDLNHEASSVQECAAEVYELVQHLGIPIDMLIGHSFGGKVALCLNELMPVKQVWVWDAEPGFKKPEHTYETVQLLKQIKMPQPTRQAVQQAILEQGLSREIAAWMTTNLRETSQGLVWKFDLDIIDKQLISFGTTAIKPQENTRFIRAESSSHMILEESERVHVLKNAGHWVHIDNPTELIDLMGDSFKRVD
ncbi:MAG: alpha/beta hydrolase [Myxococcaceae bacterium]